MELEIDLVLNQLVLSSLQKQLKSKVLKIKRIDFKIRSKVPLKEVKT
jgi:hypothetical protein